ncbi:MAG: hypothetical protein ACJ746_18420 [Bryobacteraceae bacterium]
MIGVVASPGDDAVIREFFELFKTPWEFHRWDSQYDAVLCSADVPVPTNAKLVIIYASSRTYADGVYDIRTRLQQPGSQLFWSGQRIPIYGASSTFPQKRSDLLLHENSGECAGFSDECEGVTIIRLGYDLFSEIRTLLATGQPALYARRPTLELHVALLRNLLTSSGLTLIEIPPVPEGHSFIACLTHDVDHPAIRQHKWDHTVFGFLYRAVIGSVRDFALRRIGLHQLFTSWAAAFKLPFVYLGWAQDFWKNFGPAYLDIEQGLASTFFFVPFRDKAGMTRDGSAPPFRAVRYCAADLADTIERLRKAGCEVGLHGIDAWRDADTSRRELNEICRLTDRFEVGVRMHWLYYDSESPMILENAGAAYDSTFGYNDTIGYRAGTTQAFKPLNARRLMELPLHVMDTALFYPSHLGLSFEQAIRLVREMLENTESFGGCITINWHDRSTAPERFWGAFYRDLIHDLATRGAWFATAGQAVSWFRKRRLASFETDCNGLVRLRLPKNHEDSLPGLRLRLHRGREKSEIVDRATQAYMDRVIDESGQAGCSFLRPIEQASSCDCFEIRV